MEVVTVSIDRKWARVIRSPVYYIVAAFSGVAVTFVPLFLFQMGPAGAEYSDWRVYALLATTWSVVLVHYRLSYPVIHALREPQATQ